MGVSCAIPPDFPLSFSFFLAGTAGHRLGLPVYSWDSALFWDLGRGFLFSSGGNSMVLLFDSLRM